MTTSIVNQTVAAVRKDDDLFAILVEMTELTPRKLRNRLKDCDGRTRLRNALADDLDLTYEGLRRLTVKQARAWGLASEIAHEWKLSGEEVEEKLRAVHGATSLQRAFGTVEDDSDDEESGNDHIEDSAPTDVVLRKKDSPEPFAGAEQTETGTNDVVRGWSRLQPIRAFFGRLGLPIPDPFGQQEFGTLIEALELRGFEVATAEGVQISPLHDALSIDAEIRVRHDALSAPVPSLHAHNDRQTGSVERGTNVRGDYEHACLRLELLTASSIPMPTSPEWLSRCVDIAIAGLSIRPTQRRLLLHVAEAMMQASRNPIMVLMGLVSRLDQEDGQVLLNEYASLHAGNDELQALLCEHWNELCGE